MDKVLLASVYYQLNYGSILQSYATQLAIEKLGYEVETINCKKINKQVKKRKICFYLKNIIHFKMFFMQLERYTLKFRGIYDKKFRHNLLIRLRSMKNFQETKFHLTEEVNLTELKDLCNENIKAVVVGSDQLWLPSNIIGDYFTLNYIPDSVKKISYGTSFGISKLPESLRNISGNFLSRFIHISVREESGKEIIQKLTGCKEAEVVCDPTILIEADLWKEIMPSQKMMDKNYIFCYFLGNNPQHREMVRKYANRKNAVIVTLPHLEQYVKLDEEYADIELYDVSPLDFLNLIYYADEIFTDSFHGTVFSILFHKSFYVLKRYKENEYISTNTRIDNLLKKLHLESRLIGREIYEHYENINYLEVDTNIKKFRNASQNFLIQALE